MNLRLGPALAARIVLGLIIVFAVVMIAFSVSATTMPRILSTAGGPITSPPPARPITDTVHCPGSQPCSPDASPVSMPDAAPTVSP